MSPKKGQGTVLDWFTKYIDLEPLSRNGNRLPTMSTAQLALEYLLVYCTSHGLTSIGEPPLPKTYRPVGDSLLQTQRKSTRSGLSQDSKDALPVWIIFIFLGLATAKYILSFVVSITFDIGALTALT